MPVLIEACVESVPSALAAQQGGAGRIELCANLVEGGTTPSAGTIAGARAGLTIPIHVMIRPRGGDFHYSAHETAVMRSDVALAKSLGADGVVIGALEVDGAVDSETTRALVEAARPMAVTFHRAFDMTRDPHDALETLVELGIDRVLTSGQRPEASEALDLLAALMERAGERIGVLVGGNVRADNAVRIARATGARELHVHVARTFASPMQFRNSDVYMGTPEASSEYLRRETHAEDIRAVVRAVSALG